MPATPKPVFNTPEGLESYLSQGNDINDVLSDGTSPLMNAVFGSRQAFEATRKALTAGADVHAICKEDFAWLPKGATALHAAALKSSAKLVEMLLGAGADPGVKDATDSTPMDYAKLRGKESLIRALKGTTQAQPPKPSPVVGQGTANALAHLLSLQSTISCLSEKVIAGILAQQQGRKLTFAQRQVDDALALVPAVEQACRSVRDAIIEETDKEGDQSHPVAEETAEKRTLGGGVTESLAEGVALVTEEVTASETAENYPAAEGVTSVTEEVRLPNGVFVEVKGDSVASVTEEVTASETAENYPAVKKKAAEHLKKKAAKVAVAFGGEVVESTEEDEVAGVSLFEVCQFGSPYELKNYLAAHPDEVNNIDEEHGENAVFFVLKNRTIHHVEMIQTLAKRGCNLAHRRTLDDGDALQMAVCKTVKEGIQWQQTAKALIDLGVPVDSKSGKWGLSALDIAKKWAVPQKTREALEASAKRKQEQEAESLPF